MQLSGDRSHYTKEGALPPNSPLLAAWEGLALIWDGVIAEAYPIVEDNWNRGRGPGETLGVLRQCFEAALQFDSTEPRLLMSELTVMGALLPTLRLVPEGMPYVLRKLFTAIDFNAEVDRLEQSRELGTEETRRTGLSDSGQVRRKAGSLLITLCAQPPPCFLEVLDEVVGHVQSLLARPQLAEMTHHQLVTALAAALNALPEAATQARYLAQLFGDMMTEWSSPNVTSLVSDPAQLVAAGAVNNYEDDAMLPRMHLLRLVTTVDLVLRRTEARDLSGGPAARPPPKMAAALKGESKGSSSSPAVGGAAAGDASPQVWEKANPALYPSAALARLSVPNIFSLCRTLHWLWTPECTLVPQPVLELRRSDLYNNMTNMPDMVSASGDSTWRAMTGVELWLDRTQLWLTSLRSAVYGAIEQAARQGILYESQARLDEVRQCCLHGVATMQKRHLKLFVRHVVDPYTRYAPRTAEAMPLVIPFLADAYSTIVEHVLRLWEEQRSRSAGRRPAQKGDGSGKDGQRDARRTQAERLDGSGGGVGAGLASPGELLSEEQREVLEDKLLQDLTEVLLKHIGPMVTRAAGERADMLCQHIMHTGPAALALMRLLCTSLTLPSSIVASKAGTMLSKVVAHLGMEKDYQELIAQQVLPFALQGLGVHGEHAENLTTLLLLVWRCLEWVGRMPSVQQTLLQIPNATPAEVSAVLEGATDLRSEDPGPGTAGKKAGSATAAQRKLRQRLRELLSPIIGVNVGQAWREDVRVHDLPERLFLARMVPASDDDDGTGAAIFQTIFES